MIRSWLITVLESLSKVGGKKRKKSTKEDGRFMGDGSNIKSMFCLPDGSKFSRHPAAQGN